MGVKKRNATKGKIPPESKACSKMLNAFLMTKRASTHGKSEKAQRAQFRQKIQKELYDLIVFFRRVLLDHIVQL